MKEGKSTPGKYDVIIVGGGISGLTCANYLARAGKKVLLLEQSHHAGGCMSGFWREGFYFDGGDQSFESGGVVFPILKELGVYDLHQWEKVGYRIKTPGQDTVITSLDSVEEHYRREFPGDPGISVVFNEVRQFYEFMDSMVEPAGVKIAENPSAAAIFKAVKTMPKFRKWMDPDYRTRLCRAIRNETARKWFSTYGYERMPFFLFAAFWYMWVKDYWYPAGGMQAFIDSLVAKLAEFQGEVRFKTGVKKILVADGRAEGVVTESGEEIPSGHVVYTGDYRKFVFDILGESYFEPALVEKIKKQAYSSSMVAVFLGLDIPAEELKGIMRTHHVIRFPSFEVISPGRDSERDVHTRTWVELSSPNFGGAGLSPPGKSSLVLQSFSSAEFQDCWQNRGYSLSRTTEYRQFKKEVGMHLVRTAEAVIPGLSEKIAYMEVGTPLSIQRFTRNTLGATAGWSYTQSQDSLAGKYGYVQIRTPVRRLYTAGHYCFWPGGIPSAIASGKFAAGFVLRKSPYLQVEKLSRAAAAFKRTPIIDRIWK